MLVAQHEETIRHLEWRVDDKTTETEGLLPNQVLAATVQKRDEMVGVLQANRDYWCARAKDPGGAYIPFSDVGIEVL